MTNATEAAECFGQGYHLASQKKYAEAIRCFDRKLEIAPEAEAYIERGIAERKSRQLEAAVEDYDQAIRLQPDSAIAYFDRGNVNGDLGRTQDAIRDYSEAIRIDRKHVRAYGNRGNRYIDLGMYEQAQADFTKAIELAPDAKAYSNRGVTYLRTNQYTRAVADFDEAFRRSPREPEAYNNRGAALFHMGQFEASVASYDKAVTLEPDYLDAWVGRVCPTKRCVNSTRPRKISARRFEFTRTKPVYISCAPICVRRKAMRPEPSPTGRRRKS